MLWLNVVCMFKYKTKVSLPQCLSCRYYGKEGKKLLLCSRKEQRMLKDDPARLDELVLVDGLDRPLGTATKEQAHVDGLLHRAFSVVLMSGEGTDAQVLIARRALEKYHSGGLWANSCCSHPRAGEALLDAAYRRVTEELGVTALGLREVAAFAYRAAFENGLVEYEFDHVLVGTCEGELKLDPAEVSEVRWVRVDDLARELVEKPADFCAWAPTVFSLALR